MSEMVKSTPESMRGAIPYLTVNDGPGARAFYARAFGAVELGCLTFEDGRVAHARMRIGQAHFAFADECPPMGMVGPLARGGATSQQLVYVEDVDAFVERAVAAGAELLAPVANPFYGDRIGRLRDPFGHQWIFSTRIEELTPERMQVRFDEWMSQCGKEASEK